MGSFDWDPYELNEFAHNIAKECLKIGHLNALCLRLPVSLFILVFGCLVAMILVLLVCRFFG